MTAAGAGGARRPRPFALACAIGLASSVTAGAGVVSPEYEALLRRYARGERVAAVSALSRFRAGDLDQQVKQLQRAAKERERCPSCPDPLKGLPLKAAVMVHADRDEAERPLAAGSEQPRPCPGDHARRAGQIAALLAEREATSDFARRFFLSMAQLSQWDCCLEAALSWGNDGLDRFPRDPALLLAVGAIHAEQAILGGLSLARTAVAQRRPKMATVQAAVRRSGLLEARRYLSNAVAADPALVEARVRLGRVQWHLGDDAAAGATLEEAVRQGGAPRLVYLAHLFLGQVRERSGRADEAIREFTRALDLDPQSQAAAVALSQALLSGGDVEGARAVLGRGLAHAGQRVARDAQWDYLAGNGVLAKELAEELREETRE